MTAGRFTLKYRREQDVEYPRRERIARLKFHWIKHGCNTPRYMIGISWRYGRANIGITKKEIDQIRSGKLKEVYITKGDAARVLEKVTEEMNIGYTWVF
jgi:hypothetical protein